MPAGSIDVGGSVHRLVETFNASGGRKTLKKRLATTMADVLLAQEIGHVASDLEALTSWSQGRGWRVLALASAPSAGVLPSAGVAVFLRDGHGLRRPQMGDMQVWEHRVQHVVLDVDQWPTPLHVINMYLFTGEGAGGKNAALLAKVGTLLHELDQPAIVGGDWNFPPGELEASEFTTLSGTVVKSTNTVTCRGGTGSTIIDYFVMNSASERAFAGVEADLTWAKRPHRPVQLRLRGNPSSLQKLVYTRVPSLGRTRMIGPSAHGSCWRAPKAVADAAKKACCDPEVSAQTSWCLMSRAWGMLAPKMARHIGAVTGSTINNVGAFGQQLQAPWVTLTYTMKDPADAQAVSDGWQWLANGVRHLAQLHRAAAADAGAMCQAAEEVAALMSMEYVGQGLSARLDNAVEEARAFLARSVDPEICDSFLESINEDVELAARGENRQAYREWKDWCVMAAAGGARVLHKTTQYKSEYVPTVVEGKSGPSAHPHDVLAHEVAVYEALWKNVGQPATAWIPNRDVLEPMTAGELRKVASSFPTATSASVDGFHPRHFAMLDDEVLEIVATLFTCFEALGLLPRQLTWVITPMIPKGKAEGHRLIVLYAGVYRVWQRARRPVLADLQAGLSRSYWGAGRGRSAIDCAWLQAAEAEADMEEARFGVTMIADYTKYYEEIDITLLRDKFVSRGAPMGFIKLVYNMWTAPRLLRLQGHHARRALFPQLGLPAGDAYCDISVQVWAVAEFDELVSRNPMMTFRSYIDDNSMRVSSCDEGRAEAMAVQAFGDFQQASGSLGARLNDKLTIVGTSIELARRVASAAGLPPSVAKVSAIYVGTDFTEARCRAAPKASRQRQSRKRKMILRLRKLRRFSSGMAGVDKAGTSRKIIRMGVVPAACYGAEIAGLDDGEWAKMRATHARGQLPAHGGISISAKLVLQGDGAGKLAVAPAVQWCRMLWIASTSEHSMTSVAHLLRLWDAAAPGVGGSWAESRGPLQRAVLSVRRAGWTIQTATGWTDHRGCLVLVGDTPPSLLGQLMQAGIQRQHELALALKAGDDDGPAPVPLRASFDVVKQVLGPRSRRYSKHQKLLIASCSCQGLLTRSRARRAGYITDGMCECGQLDDVKHRLYDCQLPHIVAAREAADIPASFLERGSSSSDPIFTQGLFIYDESLIPPPSCAPEVLIEDGRGNPLDIEPEELARLSTAPVLELATDGSCTKPALRELERATWSLVVQAPGQAEVVGLMKGVVPGAFPRPPVWLRT